MKQNTKAASEQETSKKKKKMVGRQTETVAGKKTFKNIGQNLKLKSRDTETQLPNDETGFESDQPETDNSGGFQMFAAPVRPNPHRKTEQRQTKSNSEHRNASVHSAAAVRASRGVESDEDADIVEEKGFFKGVEEERSFADLGLEAWLVKSCEQVGLRRPTDIQWNCIGPALQGKDMLASAETGSGKTAAFALPIIQQLSKDPYGVYGLVLTPTRELAFQIQDQFVALGTKISLRLSVVVGGMDMMKQALELCTRPHVVVATPGRMADHVTSSVGVEGALQRVRYLVLDEADRLLEPCFEGPLGTILGVLPAGRVTWLYSATITSSIDELRSFALKDCFQFVADDPTTTVSTVAEQYIHLPRMVKECYLVHVLRASKAKALIVFTGKRATCQFITMLLEEVGEEVAAIHSGLKQLKRLANLDKSRPPN